MLMQVLKLSDASTPEEIKRAARKRLLLVSISAALACLVCDSTKSANFPSKEAFAGGHLFMVFYLFAGLRVERALGQWGVCPAAQAGSAGPSPGRYMLKCCRLVSSDRASAIKAHGHAGSSDHVLGARLGRSHPGKEGGLCSSHFSYFV